ncbi:MAG: hypothetical protein HY675_16390 [Chloroflexi bacterium]|nr:hypothetical protein [Chloroflexota bacterium]
MTKYRLAAIVLMCAMILASIACGPAPTPTPIPTPTPTPIPTYSLTTSVVGGGSLNPPPGANQYRAGTSVNLSAVPQQGWKFDGWTGDVTGNTPAITVAMDRQKAITANFSKVTYILSTAVKGNGSISPAPGAANYDAGASVPLSASPATGWAFNGWTGDVTGSSSSMTTTMDRNKTITAVFVRPPKAVGPTSMNIGTGYGSVPIWGLSRGDQVEFSFTVAGADVYYTVSDPNGSTILQGSGGTKVSRGQGAFIAALDGRYSIDFASSGILTSSVLTVNYTVTYPAP